MWPLKIGWFARDLILKEWQPSNGCGDVNATKGDELMSPHLIDTNNIALFRAHCRLLPKVFAHFMESSGHVTATEQLSEVLSEYCYNLPCCNCYV